MLAATLLGACLGFLVYNFNPASIFMGDTGSLFLGFMVAGLSLVGGWPYSRGTTLVLLLPVLVVLVPIFDTTFVTVTRKLSGRPVSQGGRDHTSHRLVALGMSERRATLLLYMFAALSGALALAVRQVAIWGALALVAGFALSALFIGLYLGKVGVYEESRSPKLDAASGTLIDPLGNLSHRRRIIEILLDTVLVALAYYCAYLLRFDGDMPGEQIMIFIRTLPLLVAV